MLPRRTFIILVLLAVAVVASVSAYSFLRSQESAITIEPSMNITHYELNRKTSELVSVNITNFSNSSATLVSAKMVKIQSGIAVSSSTFQSPFSLVANSTIRVPLNFKLDPEGADYFIYIYTSKGTAIKGSISYP
ncbi:MAG: hypothetical protein NO516_02085 [Candidatus Methanomethylicia archaeon]|nr:hypothetical protein [Candidatus Methanomethylicia archaeon]